MKRNVFTDVIGHEYRTQISALHRTHEITTIMPQNVWNNLDIFTAKIRGKKLSKVLMKSRLW